jgi:3-hydroxyacyl-CoA dehydrogenase
MDSLKGSVVGVVGAGTMGSGIAQVVASAGHRLVVYDAVPGAAQRAVSTVGDRLEDYPLGPIEWGERWGFSIIYGVLTQMQAAYGDSRYRPGPLLRRMAMRK